MATAPPSKTRPTWVEQSSSRREGVGLHLRGVLTDRVARAVARSAAKTIVVTRDEVAGIGR